MSNQDSMLAFHHREIVDGVQVRLIYPFERPRWDELVRQYHYLGFHSLVGKTLRYVAVFDQQAVTVAQVEVGEKPTKSL